MDPKAWLGQRTSAVLSQAFASIHSYLASDLDPAGLQAALKAQQAEVSGAESDPKPGPDDLLRHAVDEIEFVLRATYAEEHRARVEEVAIGTRADLEQYAGRALIDHFLADRMSLDEFDDHYREWFSTARLGWPVRAFRAAEELAKACAANLRDEELRAAAQQAQQLLLA